MKRVDMKGLVDTLRVYGVGGKLFEGIKFYENASASVLVNRELSESFNVEVGVRQRCVMSPWLFNIYIDGCTREMKVGVQDVVWDWTMSTSQLLTYISLPNSLRRLIKAFLGG